MGKFLIAGLVILLLLGLGVGIWYHRHHTAVTPPVTSTTPLSSFNPGQNINSSSSASLPAIIASNSQLVSADTKQPVKLKGFVTITNYTNGQVQNYTSSDYQNMHSYGANYQSIRIGAKAIGAWPGQSPTSSYLSQLDQMVAGAKTVGMYSEFKLTIYDLPQFQKGGQDQSWGDFWRNQHGEQQALINAWTTLWQHYKGENALIGYDLLNEPQKGDLNASDEQFVSQYLGPFYQKAIDKLQTVDGQKLALFQPALGKNTGYLAFNFNLQRKNIVYAPHLYPDLVDYLKSFSGTSVNSDANFLTRDYNSTLQRYLQEGKQNNAPILIGEYGMPWDPKNDGNSQKQQLFAQIETKYLQLFAQYNLSYSRPWYSDDRAKASTPLVTLDWAMIKGEDGLGGQRRDFILNVFKAN